METATEKLSERREADMDERALHNRMEWFSKKYAPADKRECAEWHADLLLVVQAVHRDASRETHRLLGNALALMPPTIFTGARSAGESPVG